METKEYKLELRTVDVYFQKSKRFLFPLLGISSKSVTQPLQTYIIWPYYDNELKYRLICVYKLKNDSHYKHFEKMTLLSNPFFEDFKETTDNKGIYIFNISSFAEDYKYFLDGKYSLFSKESKNTILKFFTNPFTNEYLNSYLNPGNYFYKYAKLLNVDIKLLKEVGELCDKFNMEEETYNGIIEETTLFNLNINNGTG